MTFTLPQLNKLEKAIKEARLNVTLRKGWNKLLRDRCSA